MSGLLRSIVAACLVLCASESGRAEGWSLWPFGGSKEKSTATYAAHSEPVEPNVFQKMGQGTQQFFANTADFFTPGDRSDKVTGSVWRHERQPVIRKKQESWFSKMFGPREPQGPRTVNEFLSQPRPE